MLKCNWKQATRLLSSLLLVFLMGCAQDSALTEPKVVAENGDLGFRGEDPDLEIDCRCYMQARSATNAPAGVFDGWILVDVTPNKAGNYEVEGVGNQWLKPGQPLMDMPSLSEELRTPSNGLHMFYLAVYHPSGNPIANDFTINTVVRCHAINSDGSDGPLMTTTFHSFRWDAGSFVQGGAGTSIRAFQKEFSCLVLADPGNPVSN